MVDIHRTDLGNGWTRCKKCLQWDVQCECDVLTGICPLDVDFVRETHKKLKRSSTGREVLHLLNDMYMKNAEPVMLVRELRVGLQECNMFPFVVVISIHGPLRLCSLADVVKNTTVIVHCHIVTRYHPRFAKCFYVAMLDVLEQEHSVSAPLWNYDDIVSVIRRSYRS